MTASDTRRDVGSEGAMWGTPRKRALFGPEGPHSVSSVGDVAEAQLGWPPDDEDLQVAQSGWPPGDEYLEEARSPIVDLADVVARLQKEVEEFRAESGYGSARRPAIPTRTSGWSGFMSTPVPMYAAKARWDQYRQVFEAIFCSNGWDGVTSALQLVSHLEGDTAGAARSCVRCANGTLWFSWEIGGL